MGAGAGYNVHIKGLKLGKILKKEYVTGEKSYDSYWKIKMSIAPGECEIGAEDYYNDFFFRVHEIGIDPTAVIDGGFAYIEYGAIYDDKEKDLDEISRNLEDREIDISFMYGSGWIHSDLCGKIEVGERDLSIDSKEVYFSISKIEIDSDSLADAVNSGYREATCFAEEKHDDEEDLYG